MVDDSERYASIACQLLKTHALEGIQGSSRHVERLQEGEDDNRLFL